ncbi:MAG TPA: beta-galactosidase, partial [Rhodothermales bacterium]
PGHPDTLDQIQGMNTLFKYFPFGSQYYRAPSPPPSDWDRDLSRMAGLGFNTVKFWAQWRWNHPAEARFYWDDIDRLMDLAGKHGLKVMLNTIVDVAPAWIYTKYPDASMLTRDGRRIGPQTQPHRQIGGLGVCLNHQEVMSHLFRFLEACFERYSDHPALDVWNFGSEPEVTQSMAEMREYAGNAARMGEMLCYCDHCARAFREWLRAKYESIERLNVAWNRNYASFEEAELPKTRNTFNDLIDWRMFFVHTLGENVRRRYELAKKVDAGRHPLMCHHVFIQGFPITSTANDPWNVGQYGDLHGFTQMDDPMMCDILRCCARGKPVMSAEMLMLMGYTLDLHREVDEDDVKRHVFTGIAAGVKGYVFWQYRPELLGREAPAWGLTTLDGEETPALRAFARVGEVTARNADFFLRADPRPAEVAILYHPENQIFTWAATGNEFNATDSLLGAHKALYERNYIVDFIHAKEIDEGVLDRYRVLVLTHPYVLNERIAARIRAWVEAGGVVIGEAYCAGWHLEEGRHQTIVPGYGLHEVFGARQEVAVPPLDGTEVAEMFLSKDVPGLPSRSRVTGAVICEVLKSEGAEVIAGHTDGRPAITRNTFGKGRAYLIGSYVSLAYWRQQVPENGALLAGLVEDALEVVRPRIVGGEKVRVDVVRDDEGAAAVFVRNLEPHDVEVAIQVPDCWLGRLHEQFGGEDVQCGPLGGGSAFTVRLKRGEVRVYRAEMGARE